MASIAIDIDSTLYDFATPAREAFLELANRYDDKSLFQGAYHPWTEWRSPADVCGEDIWMEVIGLCHEADVISEQVPFAGAPETCQALMEEGHHLIYISNRNTESTDATVDWLQDNGFICTGEEEVVCLMDDKKPYLKNCQYLIDDRPKTCVEFVFDFDWRERQIEEALGFSDPQEVYEDNQRRAFMKSYSYNQNLTDIPHLYLAPTWSGLAWYMTRKGLLSEVPIKPTLRV